MRPEVPLRRLWAAPPLSGEAEMERPKPPLKGEVARSAGGVLARPRRWGQHPLRGMPCPL